MKGLVVKEKSVILLKDNLEKPVPAKGEVLIKVHSASLNSYDLESAAGSYDSYFQEYGFDHPVQTGLEFSGVVESRGEKFDIGTRVYGYVHLITGCKTHAEYIVLPESYIAEIPPSLSFEEAASFPLGVLTSLSILEDLAPQKSNVKSNMNILIVGAAGGVGVYATQLAKLKGHQVTALAGKDHTDFLKQLGADKVYDYRDTNLADLPGNYDLLVDFSTKLKLDDCRHLLSAKGKFIPALPDDVNGGTSEDPQVGYLMVMHGDTARLKAIEPLIEGKSLLPIVEEVYGFDRYQAGLAHLKKSGKRGRIILNW
ncbi:NADP-dependent oxidoreductase [Kiloniella laminariae]|uniref:NADP-dependent oxidoreductase n=1 Tax=Kiloniella laminariae TaxID=454162 RepID=UPI00035CBA33|nr:NADP-dependent oxidoreductase [Kiloniella laminariae]